MSEETDPHSVLLQIVRDRGLAVPDDDGHLSGSGDQAHAAWEAFRDAATVPILSNPAFADDDMLHFEAWWHRHAYGLRFTRTTTFRDDDLEVEEAPAVDLFIDLEGQTSSDLPELTIFGYGGDADPRVSDSHHPELHIWAGRATRWAQLVEASEAFRAFDRLQPQSFVIHEP